MSDSSPDPPSPATRTLLAGMLLVVAAWLALFLKLFVLSGASGERGLLAGGVLSAALVVVDARARRSRDR